MALVTLAVPCRTDEPALGRTLDVAWARFAEARTPVTTLVCLNGADADGGPPLRALRAPSTGRAVAVVDADAGEPGPPPAPDGIVCLRTRRAGKAIAWNLLRPRLRTDTAIFLDADVALGPEAIGLLLAALARHPDAVLASPKTRCAARPTLFERIMAVPYRVDFPNLSGQLYAARTAGLPARMPEDLIEPERWLELAVGRERMVREPAATVTVRLPATLRDFYRQRVRIEMGKVQLDEEYPGLERAGNPQPRLRAALRALRPAELARLGAYLVLRETAHAVARRRWRRRATHGVWVQAASTKEWRS
jgi:hypothetical protein